MASRYSLPEVLQVSDKQIKSTKHNQATVPSPTVILSTIHDRRYNNETVISLINEAKLCRDPCFEFLWHMQKVMQLFANSAGGQTTCLRSLKKKRG